MQLAEFLTSDADGQVRIIGHRIRLIDVAARYVEGCSPETIFLDHYPSLSLPLIHKTIAFYLEHQLEVDEMISRNTAAMAELESKTPQTTPTINELRKRMAQRNSRAEAS